jgi:hypothetical protein
VALEWIWDLVRLPAHAFRRKPKPIVQNQQEAERLDRIRNPSKYQGK